MYESVVLRSGSSFAKVAKLTVSSELKKIPNRISVLSAQASNRCQLFVNSSCSAYSSNEQRRVLYCHLLKKECSNSGGQSWHVQKMLQSRTQCTCCKRLLLFGTINPNSSHFISCDRDPSLYVQHRVMQRIYVQFANFAFQLFDAVNQ